MIINKEMNMKDNSTHWMSENLVIAAEVTEAAASGVPVIALESTIITHGMPYPANVETAQALEAKIRAKNAVPATIALLEGKIHVGLSASQLESLGNCGKAMKASRRDLAFVLTRKATAGTTVACTMICAAIAGVRFFATGGVGGVHRGAAATFDISADLQELAQTQVCVVSAGAKAILDLPLTLEYLETHGVPVLGFRTEEFPSFYSRESGLKLPFSVESPRLAARVIRQHWQIPSAGGVLLANPIPVEHALPSAMVEKSIDKALAEAASRGISGSRLTPFLLAFLEQETGGRSLAANIALVHNNVEVACDIAREFNVIDKS